MTMRKDKKIEIRVTAQELALIRRKAGRQTLSTFVRNCIFTGKKEESKETVIPTYEDGTPIDEETEHF